MRRLLIRLRERKRNSSEEETRSNVDPCRRFNVVDSGTVGGVAWERVKCGTIGVKRNSCAEMLKKTDRSFELRSLADEEERNLGRGDGFCAFSGTHMLEILAV